MLIVSEKKEKWYKGKNGVSSPFKNDPLLTMSHDEFVGLLGKSLSNLMNGKDIDAPIKELKRKKVK